MTGDAGEADERGRAGGARAAATSTKDAAAPVRLYYKPRTRANRARWLLEELGVPYELVVPEIVALGKEAQERARVAYRRLHPHGMVPVLVDGDTVVFESVAICLHLADKHIDRGLAPTFGAPERARYYQWMAYAPATLEPPLGQYGRHTSSLPPAEREPAQAARARAKFDEAAAVLADALSDAPAGALPDPPAGALPDASAGALPDPPTGAVSRGPFLLGDRFSAADVIIGSNLSWARRLGLLGGWPALEAYVDRLLARPAAKRTFDEA